MKERYAKVQNVDGYKRDLRTNAIISDNTSAYNQFVAKKEKERSFASRLDNLEKTLDLILDKLDSKKQ